VKKKILPLAGLVLLVLLQAAVAWNARLWWRAKAVAAGPEEKIRILRRAVAVYPWNDAVHFELGRAYFERGAEALADPAARDGDFVMSVGSFVRSLQLNPGSPAAHFHLAQTLLYMNYLSLPAPLSYFEEYKKSARLTGHKSQIYFEVGKMLLGRWATLEPAERDFTVDILKKALAGKDEERLLVLLEAWSLDVRDYGLVDRILPEDSGTLRAYARFLGERGLSLEARHAALARAESLDFLRAKSEIDLGRRETDAYRPAEAAARFTAALETLDGVKLYQRLAGAELIPPAELDEVRKTARRLLAMSRIEETRSLADEDGAVAAYLALEDDILALGELETFIRERGLFADGPSAAAPIKDLRTLAFRTAFDFKQNRYRDIVKIGDLLASSSLVIAPSGQADFARILGLIGESHLKLDYVYEAEKYLGMALEAAPDSLDILLAVERCYARVNDEARVAEARRAIDRVTSPARIDLGGRLLPKGETFETGLVTDGRPRTIRLDFTPVTPSGRSLLAVFLNGRVVWEGKGDTGSALFPAAPRPGRVSLEIEAVGDAVRLGAIVQTLPPGR
jgi:hypothetical protein